MKKNIPLIIICFFSFQLIHAQDSSKPASPELLQALANTIDSTKFLAEVSKESCKCIDSISLTNRDNKEIVQDIKKCIDKEVTAYQLSLKLFGSLKATGKNVSISINTNQNSNEYKRYYYEIERWLNDSCASLKRAVSSENKENEYSTSKNPEALKQFDAGVDIMNKNNYAEALPYFKKAVEIDSMFVFAWDNVGLCYRKTNDLDKALEAYSKSLSIDPKGHVPLQNIAIVYEYKKDYDKEIDAYQKLLAIYPDDPEVFYGIGNVYAFYKKDLEKGLDNFCKAYNLYIKLNSPYRVDAEKNINTIYNQMKKDGKEDAFYKILADNNINVNKK